MKMIKYFQLFTFFYLGSYLLLSCSKPKFFSGMVEYQYSYESNTLNVDSLEKRKPFKSEFRFDKFNYQSSFFGPDTITYYYSGKSGKCISKNNSNDAFDCEDYRIPTDSIISYKIYDTDEKVMGHKCRIIEWQGKYFYNFFYVSTNMNIAPSTYKKHVSYNWNFYGKNTGGGLVLKSVHRFKKYTMTGIAVNIKEENKVFEALQIGQGHFDSYCK